MIKMAASTTKTALVCALPITLVCALPITIVQPNTTLFPIPKSTSIETASPLTPFSAVAPSHFLSVSVSRVQVHQISHLETIYEEEDLESEDDFVHDLIYQPAASQASSSLLSTCFLEVHRPLSSSYSNSQYCA